jgi:type I restriction enzyme M protein
VEQFDVVVSNPPFGITLAPETKKGITAAFIQGDATSSEALFLERYAQLLKPRGRLGVVMPESLLNASELRDARLVLYRFFWIRAVVSLPRNLFIETPTLTSLLFAQRKDATEIAAWDRHWTSATTVVDTAASAARAAAHTASRAGGATPGSVESAFLTALAPHLDPAAVVVRRGKNAAVLPVTLPASITTAAQAREYYDKLMKAAGFQTLLTTAVFILVTAAITNDWPVYAVDEVGYKLSKRGERIRQNQLCRFEDAAGIEHSNVQRAPVPVMPVIDAGSPTTVLDYLRRDVKWA